MKQILHEEELHKLEQSKLNVENGSSRMSERNYEAERRRRQDELEQLKVKEQQIFDCSICGSYADNYVGHSSSDMLRRLIGSRTMKCIV